MKEHRNLILGISVALLIPVMALAISILSSIRSYTGTCGGYLPWLAGPRPCTLREHVMGSVSMLALIAWDQYWRILIAVIFMPIGIGYILDRKKESAL